MPTYTERRKLSRLRLQVLLRILVVETSEEFLGETCNVSAQGIFFRSGARLKLGQYLECILVLPENLTLTDQPVLIGCQGSVVRLGEDAQGAHTGVAMEVNSYDFSGNVSFPDAVAGNKPFSLNS